MGKTKVCKCVTRFLISNFKCRYPELGKKQMPKPGYLKGFAIKLDQLLEVNVYHGHRAGAITQG